MKSIMMIALGVGLAATPALAQNTQGMLNGLLSGNQNQDRAVQDAYERGYQKGRQDEARMRPSGRDTSSNYDRRNDSGDMPRGDMSRGNMPYGTQSGMNQGRSDYSR